MKVVVEPRERNRETYPHYPQDIFLITNEHALFKMGKYNFSSGEMHQKVVKCGKNSISTKISPLESYPKGAHNIPTGTHSRKSDGGFSNSG